MYKVVIKNAKVVPSHLIDTCNPRTHVFNEITLYNAVRVQFLMYTYHVHVIALTSRHEPSVRNFIKST